MTWRWVQTRAVLAIHMRLLAEHGGPQGVRDLGLIESAVARPEHLFAYEPICDAAALAASYCIGLARNHGFVDGNKRAGFIVAMLFLDLNGFGCTVDDADAVTTVDGAAEGKISEQQLAAWFREKLAPVQS